MTVDVARSQMFAASRRRLVYLATEELMLVQVEPERYGGIESMNPRKGLSVGKGLKVEGKIQSRVFVSEEGLMESLVGIAGRVGVDVEGSVRVENGPRRRGYLVGTD